MARKSKWILIHPDYISCNLHKLTCVEMEEILREINTRRRREEQGIEREAEE